MPVHLSELIQLDTLVANLASDTVEDCLRQLVEQLATATADAGGEPPGPEERTRLVEALLDRERVGSTGLGGGVAVPHAYVPGVPATRLVIATLGQPLDFGALDGQAVDVVFLLCGPDREARRHLGLIARIARLLHDPAFLAELRGARDAAGLHKAVERVESRHP